MAVRTAAQQQTRRDRARLRGDCTTCCKRPAKPGRCRCEQCDDYQRALQNWQGGTWRREPRFIQVHARGTLVPVRVSFERKQ